MQSRCSSTAGHQHVFSWNWKKAFVVYVIWKFSSVSNSVHACFVQCWTLLHKSATLRLPLITTGQRSERCGHLAAMQLQLTVIFKELCDSRGGRPGLSVLTSHLVSVDVKIYCTVLRHWSQLVPNMSTDI